VLARDREPLIAFIVDALERDGCRIIHRPLGDQAPFRITFETPSGERLGIIAYAFLANTKLTRNRPQDEHRFQVKYGSKDGKLHALWQDPFGLYVTLFLGINPEQGFFVGADPVLHSPTKFFISVGCFASPIASTMHPPAGRLNVSRVWSARLILVNPPRAMDHHSVWRVENQRRAELHCVLAGPPSCCADSASLAG